MGLAAVVGAVNSCRIGFGDGDIVAHEIANLPLGLRPYATAVPKLSDKMAIFHCEIAEGRGT